MHFTTLFTTSALIGASLAKDITVKVSDNSAALKFTPDSIQAAEGDTVTFHFWPKNHSVAQAAFAKPCEPLENGFWSNYIPSTSGAAKDAFQIQVTNASKPIWFYCSQGMHCQNGMVGVINGPSTGNTLDAFKSNAKVVGKNVAPASTQVTGGQIVVSNASSTTPGASSSPSASGSGSPTASSSAGAASPSPKAGAAASVQAGMGAVFVGFFAVLAYAL